MVHKALLFGYLPAVLAKEKVAVDFVFDGALDVMCDDCCFVKGTVGSMLVQRRFNIKWSNT